MLVAKNIVMLLITILVQFTWYYATLPGSIVLSNKKKPKPSIKSAAISYLTYAIPLFIAFYYLNSKGKYCVIANTYVDLFCKK